MYTNNDNSATSLHRHLFCLCICQTPAAPRRSGSFWRSLACFPPFRYGLKHVETNGPFLIWRVNNDEYPFTSYLEVQQGTRLWPIADSHSKPTWRPRNAPGNGEVLLTAAIVCILPRVHFAPSAPSGIKCVLKIRDHLRSHASKSHFSDFQTWLQQKKAGLVKAFNIGRHRPSCWILVILTHFLNG